MDRHSAPFSYLASILFGVLLIWLVGLEANRKVENSERPLLIAPRQLGLFVLGYNEVVADALWLRTIQDFDYCQSVKSETTDVSRVNTSKCHNSWVYNMLDSITEVAPRFRQPYISGALILSIVIDDVSGASKIFDKAVARFPNDWQIQLYASYHAMEHEQDYVKASALMTTAAKAGAPSWTYSLAARLQQKSGRLEFARSTLESAKAEAKNEATIVYLNERLAEIDRHIAEERGKQKH